MASSGRPAISPHSDSGTLARAQAVSPGQVIEAELEDEGGLVVYEIRILTTDGRVMKLHYDAATGALLKTKDRNGRR